MRHSGNFTPTAAGTRAGTLTITDSSPGSPHKVSLSGQGGISTATLSASALAFTTQAVGTTSAPQMVTVTNNGALALTISRIQISASFSETNNCGSSLGSGNYCQISVTFSPTSQGAATGTVQLTDNAPDTPQTIALSGTGGPSFGLGISAGGSSSATVTPGASATYQLSIGGTGVSGTASLSCAGAPAAAICSVPATVNMSATTASSFNVTVTTTGNMASLHRGHLLLGSSLWAFAFIALVSLPNIRTRKNSVRRVLANVLPLIFVLAFCCSCGSSKANSGHTGTPAGSYTLTVTAQSGGATQSTTLTLNVN